MTVDDMLAQLQAMRARDLPTHGGRTLAYVYDSGIAEADQLGREALAAFSSTNGLDPTAFPSLAMMENDLVTTTGRLLDAPDEFAGVVTSGGTESILLAVLAARDAHPSAAPRMVLPTTAHAAFHKAAHYFGVAKVLVDVDPVSKRADPAAMAAAIDADTVLVVASAPSYAHGVVDPVTEIARAAAAAGVRCHVDACIGGWVLPHLDAPPWTFAVEGVTSISVDLHKYAYVPKGTSVLLHRGADLRRSHLFASADWPGYTMLNTTMQSTKSGGPLAAAWAVVQYLGLERYADLARQAREATVALSDAIRRTPGIRLSAQPDATLVALETDASCDVFTIADEMLTRGWFVQPQMRFRELPATLHFTLSAATAASTQAIVDDLRASVEVARQSGPTRPDPQILGLASSLDPRSVSEEAFGQLLAAAGLAEAGAISIPDRMAPLNALLNELPPRLREALLLGVIDHLARPTAG